MRKACHILVALSALILTSAAQSVPLRWSQLKPAGEDKRNEVILWAMEQLYSDDGLGKALDPQTQNARFQALKAQLRHDPVKEFDGKQVRIAGFIVPLGSYSGGATTEFLIVPYFGACLHLPAPNRNQIIHATANSPQKIGDIRKAYWIEGRLHVDNFESRIASTAYRMTVDSTTLYSGKANPYEGPLPHEDGR